MTTKRGKNEKQQGKTKNNNNKEKPLDISPEIVISETFI